jgi:hypothetical protein
VKALAKVKEAEKEKVKALERDPEKVQERVAKAKAKVQEHQEMQLQVKMENQVLVKNALKKLKIKMLAWIQQLILLKMLWKKQRQLLMQL